MSGGQGIGSGGFAQIANPGSPNRPDPNYNTNKVSVFFLTKSVLSQNEDGRHSLVPSGFF